jgi:hypothetical protein
MSDAVAFPKWTAARAAESAETNIKASCRPREREELSELISVLHGTTWNMRGNGVARWLFLILKWFCPLPALSQTI